MSGEFVDDSLLPINDFLSQYLPSYLLLLGPEMFPVRTFTGLRARRAARLAGAHFARIGVCNQYKAVRQPPVIEDFPYVDFFGSVDGAVGLGETPSELSLRTAEPESQL